MTIEVRRMSPAELLRRARTESGLSLRALAARAATSHSTLAAYEAGRTTPSPTTLDRILGAAGYAIDRTLAPRCRGTVGLPKGEELRQVLDLAAAFPARVEPELAYPVFGRR